MGNDNNNEQLHVPGDVLSETNRSSQDECHAIEIISKGNEVTDESESNELTSSLKEKFRISSTQDFKGRTGNNH